VRSRISYTVWRAIERPFMAAAARMRRYESKDRLLGLLGPVSLLALLGAWLLLFLLGYALVLLPLTGDGFMAARRLSGSSLFTLGLAFSPRQGATVVSFAAAATGLVVVALQVGYLPTIYGAYNRRETVVNMLESRAGEPAWGWSCWPASISSGAWTRWGRSSPTGSGGPPTSPRATSTTPGCCRSARRIRCAPGWSATSRCWTPRPVPGPGPKPGAAGGPALPAHRLPGVAALAGVYRVELPDDPRPDAPIVLTYQEFSDGLDRLEAVGFPMEQSPEEAAPTWSRRGPSRRPSGPSRPIRGF
jgi:hypothetical protein